MDGFQELSYPHKLAPPRLRRAAAPSHEQVLIADDIAENRTLLAMLCEQLGLSHECVDNGYDALEAASSGRFDAILMDIFMPRMDGMTVTMAIRALPEPIGSTPIIALATSLEPRDVQRYRACGFNFTAPKPILAPRLLDALSSVLAERRAVLRAGQSRTRGAEIIRLSA